MNIRRFTAPEMKEALTLVKAALGEDAIILKTRKVRKGGLLSFLSKELVEVTAASPDRKPLPGRINSAKVAQAKRNLSAHPSVGIMRDLQEEIKDLTGHVRELSEQVKLERMPSLPSRLAKHYKGMVRSGVDDKLAKELAQSINLKFKGEELENDKLVDKALQGMIAKRITVRRPPKSSSRHARIFALIGPTGVGKTTTLAKLVTSYRHWGRDDTALVSIDTYRVAAIEQLKTFAAIAGLPMEAVYKPAALGNALDRHNSRDAIFIDTAGRSQVDKEKLDELESFLKVANPDEVLLCLSVPTRLEDQLDIIQKYRRLKPTGIIFTKLDESKGPGLILSTLDRTSLPVTYLTCGQNVPEDIMVADSGRLADLIMNPESLTKLQRSRFHDWITAENGNN